MDYELEQAAIIRALKEAEGQKATRLNTGIPENRMVSGRYVPPGAAVMMNSVLQPALGRYNEDAALKRQADLNAGQDAEVQNYIKQMTTPGTVLSKTLRQGEGPLAEPNIDQTERPMSAEEENQRQMGLSMEAMRLPKARAMATQFVNSGVGFPEKMAQLKMAAEEKEAARLFQSVEQSRRDKERLEDKKVFAQFAAGLRPTQDKLQIAYGPDGNANRVNLTTGEVSPLEGVGKPRSAAQSKLDAVKDKRIEDANSSDSLLSEVEKLLPVATSSMIGKGRDVALGAFGSSTKAGEAAQKLKVIAPALVMKVPRFEGPQSDKDTALYREAAGDLANETLPMERRVAALDQLRRLNRIARREDASGAATTPPASGQTPAAGPRQAPQAALKALAGNPALAADFKAKFGYLPPGF